LAGSPKGALNGVYEVGEGVDGGELAADGVEEGVADGGYVLEDAAGEGEVGYPGGLRDGGGGEVEEAVDDEEDECAQLLTFVLEDALGDEVAFLGALEDEGGETGDVGGGGGVGVLDEVVEGGEVPEVEDGGEEGGGGGGEFAASGLVDGAEDGTEGRGADAMAGALVGERGPPAAGGGDGGGVRAARDVGAGAGDDDDAGLAGEGGVEGDLYVAEKSEGTGDAGAEGVAEPVGDERDTLTGGADAGAGDGGHGDAGEGGELGEGLIKIVGGGAGVDTEALDGAGADAGELAMVVGEKVIGLGAANIDGEIEAHLGLLYYYAFV
jgi:hypothetical protein